MSFINFAAREINCKIVYYGAGLGGKTTNLQWIFEQTLGKTGGKMISLATETDRTLFFDFLPLDLGRIRGFKTRFHLYTVPGQVFYDASRKLILRGVDGVIFVADSQEERMDANIEALENLDENLREHNYDFKKIPYVLQLNKRDLPNALPVEELKKVLLKKDEPVFEAVAYKGVGVFETLKECGRLVLAELKKGRSSRISDFGLAHPVTITLMYSTFQPHNRQTKLHTAIQGSKIQYSVRFRGAGEGEEMVPHDGQGDGLAEVVPVLPQRLDEEFPVLASGSC